MPRRAQSGANVSRLCADGVAAFQPCGVYTSPTGSLAAGGEPEARENPLLYADQKGHRD